MAIDNDKKKKEILEKLKKMRNPSKDNSNVDNKLNQDSIKKSNMVSVRRRDWATRENCR